MTRYSLFHAGLICLWLMALGPMGCRLNNDRDFTSDAEKSSAGGNATAGGTLDDANSVAPDAGTRNGGGNDTVSTRSQ
ncbi:MAG: hypothetical protein JXA30_06495 [Deltaproteobacteria bacterium]|nr:hypothetical protein [Deltaproteobacteria bacterium]